MTQHPVLRDGDATGTFSIRAEAEQTRLASSWLDAFCRECAVPDMQIGHLDLCLNEVLANVLMHGGDAGRNAPIEMQLVIRGQGTRSEATLRISDAGPAFDPLAVELRSRPASLEEADIGGLGIPMLRAFSERISYRRSEERNHLSLVVSWEARETAPVSGGRVANLHLVEAGTAAETSRASALRHEDFSWIPLFHSLNAAQLAEMLAECEVLTFEAGAHVMRPGERNPYIYVLLSGHVDVFLDAHLDEATATPVEPGELFGILSGIDGKIVSAIVLPRTEARVIRITWETFRDRFMTLPGVAAQLIGNMVERMRRNNSQALTALREQLEFDHLRREMEMARRLQANMLPQQRPLFPDRQEIEVCGLMEPAARVGGDLFDAFFVDKRHLFFCVGDAAGHGVTAAMVMARTIGLLHQLAMSGMPPHELMGELNDRLATGNETSLFVTLLCGLLDVESGRLTYANGGHCAPIVITASGAELLPVPKGSVVGAFAGKRFSLMEMRLAEGDTLLCYTDGLTEAQNPAGEQFSVRRCLDVAAREGAGGPTSLLDALYAELGRFTQSAAHDDDFTMLAIRRRKIASRE